MPTNSYTITRLDPVTFAAIPLGAIPTESVTADFVLEMNCPADPGATGNVLVPDLATMRSGAFCKQFVNIAAVCDANGDVTDDASRSLLTGGYISVRETTSAKGNTPRTYAIPPVLIPTAVNFVTGYTNSPADLTANGGTIRLRFNPNTQALPGGTFNPNKHPQFLYAKELPYVSMSTEVSGGGGGGGAGA